MSTKEQFISKILEIEKKECHLNILGKDAYENLLNEVEDAQKAVKKTQKQYRRLSRFKVINTCGTRKLVNKKEPTKYYLHLDEVYDVIEAAHVASDHGGRDKIKKVTSKNYANITMEMINTFLTTCEICNNKKRAKKRRLVSKSILPSQMITRCQVNLIDMREQEDNGFNFIMVYQDDSTKFTLLRALKSKTATEVAHQLTDIFLTFGAPCILHSDNGREFVNLVIKELASLWSDCKIIPGNTRDSHSLESINQDVEQMLSWWMQENNTTNWSGGIGFVQFSKNGAFHCGINQSPYKAMFGNDPRMGLTTSFLPMEKINDVRDEDDLNLVLEDVDVTNDESELVYSTTTGVTDQLEVTLQDTEPVDSIVSMNDQQPHFKVELTEQPEYEDNINHQFQFIAAPQEVRTSFTKQAKRTKLASDGMQHSGGSCM